ncbi:MAG: YihY family inner membrane protein [Burkholderiales bacterium]|nr:YihY family inner membrane protein [Burkholderiales bacterium]MBK9345823.1 YihY family inner membrane protein [Burkholderiales bacterium]
MPFLQRLQNWLRDVAHIPWRSAAQTLRERFREDRLGLTASSLTFTTMIALVPLITVGLAVFTAFPMFAKFQDVLQKWLIESLVPDNIARQVLGYLNQFAGKASRLGAVGLAFLLGSALALILTIDRTLNSIWRVRTQRPFARRVQIYWTVLTLGPLLLGVSLSITSYAVSVSKGIAGGLPGGVSLVLELLQFVLVAAGMAAMYRYVPNTHVRWGHAWMGGVFVSTGMELAKKLLTLYLVKVPTYSVVYGAFATVPILLIWIYVVWVIVLLGAALTAYMPSLLTGVPQRRLGHGWQFQLALEVLQQLAAARHVDAKGSTPMQLCSALKVDPLRLEPVLQALQGLDWVGELNEADDAAPQARYVLLIDPAQTPLAPLMATLLLEPSLQSQLMDKTGHWPLCTVREVLLQR